MNLNFLTDMWPSISADVSIEMKMMPWDILEALGTRYLFVRNRFSLSLKLTKQLLLAKRRTGVTPLRADATLYYRLIGTCSDCIYTQVLD
jgi:hypothetical protein